MCTFIVVLYPLHSVGQRLYLHPDGLRTAAVNVRVESRLARMGRRVILTRRDPVELKYGHTSPQCFDQ